jgi:hypothetical protein
VPLVAVAPVVGWASIGAKDSAAGGAANPSSQPVTAQQIQDRAYAIWKASGGTPLGNWYTAETQLRSEHAGDIQGAKPAQ